MTFLFAELAEDLPAILLFVIKQAAVSAFELEATASACLGRVTILPARRAPDSLSVFTTSVFKTIWAQLSSFPGFLIIIPVVRLKDSSVSLSLFVSLYRTAYA